MYRLALVALAVVLLPCTVLASPTGYVQTDLVSNATDPDLQNPWGIAFGASTPFWIADNGSGLATLYDGDGTKRALVVTIPPAPGSPAGTSGTPTGAVFNTTVGNPSPDTFVFATQDGILAGWQPSLGTSAAVRVDSSAAGTVYTGLAIVGNRFYATDFNNARIDVFDSSYAAVSLAGSFTDPNLPSGYAPFGIQAIAGQLYVTYALKGAGGNETSGPGFGFVDRFDANGNLLQRLVVGTPGDPTSPLNAPWGIALAPATFGDLSSLLLIGNHGNGLINAFDPATGTFVGSLTDAGGTPIAIDGLWSLAFGNNGPGFDPDALYFTAGVNNETGGLFGSLQPVPEPATALLLSTGLVAMGLAARRRGSPVRRWSG